MPKDYLALPVDDNGQAIQAGSGFVTQDATGTPQTSPLAVSSTVITLVVPDNAAEVVFSPSAAMRVSEISTMARYTTVAAGSTQAFSVGRMERIYVVRNSGDLTLNFYFVTV